jgi:hypothetical protein
VYNNLDEIGDIERFKRSMIGYLIWYNTNKVHRYLNNKLSLKYYLDEVINNSKKSNMLWTLTEVVKRGKNLI